jgi:putative hydrolase of the HAD superfamily
MIQAIIFDCFGVLTTDLWREFTATLPDAQRRKAGRLNQAYCSGSLTSEEFLEAVADLTGTPQGRVRNIITNEGAGANKNTRLLALIAVLKRSYKIALLSNVASSWVRDDFLTAEEQKLFDSFTFSYEVGLAKPDPRMFRLAAKRLDVPPSACVLVDDVERYCDVARELGMQTILYQNFPQAKLDLEQTLAA